MSNTKERVEWLSSEVFHFIGVLSVLHLDERSVNHCNIPAIDDWTCSYIQNNDVHAISGARYREEMMSRYYYYDSSIGWVTDRNSVRPSLTSRNKKKILKKKLVKEKIT